MSILLAAVGGLASGVFLRSLFIFGGSVYGFALILAALFAGALFLVPRRAYLLGLLFCLFVCGGALRVTLAETMPPPIFTNDLNHRVSYQAIVVGDPDMRDTSVRIPLRATRGGASTGMLAVAPRGTPVAVGDRVFVSGTLHRPEPFAGDTGRTFRYDKYLEARGTRFLLDYAYVRVEHPAPWYSLSAALARSKHAFIEGIASGLPEPAASLASGIVIGGKSGLGQTLQDAFVRSGLVQIIVLSGYNVMVVAEWVMLLGAALALPKRTRAALGALALFLFIGIAGAAAPSVRAALMALIALFARATGRTYAASRALLLVLLLMLLWNPLLLVFDPGFGLSVTATAGLIWLAPRIEGLLPFRSHALLRNALATTLAAQLAVLPLLLYLTGNLSLAALPANLLVMPVMPLAMGLSALSGLAGMLFHSLAPALAAAVSFPAYLALTYVLFIATKSAAFPFAALSVPAFSFLFVLGGYAALIYFAASKRFSTTLQLRFARKAST